MTFTAPRLPEPPCVRVGRGAPANGNVKPSVARFPAHRVLPLWRQQKPCGQFFVNRTTRMIGNSNQKNTASAMQNSEILDHLRLLNPVYQFSDRARYARRNFSVTRHYHRLGARWCPFGMTAARSKVSQPLLKALDGPTSVCFTRHT